MALGLLQLAFGFFLCGNRVAAVIICELYFKFSALHYQSVCANPIKLTALFAAH